MVVSLAFLSGVNAVACLISVAGDKPGWAVACGLMSAVSGAIAIIGSQRDRQW
jgi:hypothetical protein